MSRRPRGVLHPARQDAPLHLLGAGLRRLPTARVVCGARGPGVRAGAHAGVHVPPTWAGRTALGLRRPWATTGCALPQRDEGAVPLEAADVADAVQPCRSAAAAAPGRLRPGRAAPQLLRPPRSVQDRGTVQWVADCEPAGRQQARGRLPPPALGLSPPQALRVADGLQQPPPAFHLRSRLAAVRAHRPRVWHAAEECYRCLHGAQEKSSFVAFAVDVLVAALVWLRLLSRAVAVDDVS
mmetsp:Transcript_86144/g.278783  ORF Transcript_86144/g.278783 Transcript_86144/m.278783 type:complete len:239 (+) Transcript_86144:271-987(+)